METLDIPKVSNQLKAPLDNAGAVVNELHATVRSWEVQMVDRARLMSDGSRTSVVTFVASAKARLKRILSARVRRLGRPATELSQPYLHAALAELNEAIERSAGKVIGIVTGSQK